MAGITTSIRLSPELRERLERTASRLHRGKSWVIARAIEQYLTRQETGELRDEARRQSQLASTAAWPDEPHWEGDVDERGWKA